MRSCHTHITCIGLLLLSMLTPTALGNTRESVSLDGVWDFSTDLDSVGEFEKWYLPGATLPSMPLPGYAPEANGKIRVPGVWDNQGYGTATSKVRHSYVGKGWYKRQIEVPRNWSGRRIFLIIGGVQRYAKVWVDDHLLGEHIGCVSIQEYDVTKHVTPGNTSVLTIQVDSKQRWDIDSIYGTSSLADYMDIAWGGVWGHVSLEARSDCWLGDLFVESSVSQSSCTASATLGGNADQAEQAKLEVFDDDGKLLAEAQVDLTNQKLKRGAAVSVEAKVPDAKLWSPDAPVLYKAQLSLLRGNQLIDALECRFGMRQFTIDGPYILLNGRRIMLRGYGDDHIYPEQMAMPADKELYLKRLRLAKSYGFNFVRNHSAIMPPEFYDACDEVGMIATAEFPICYHIYLPPTGYMWQAFAPPVADPKPPLETYLREWERAVIRYRNHPSVMAWARGNELYEPNLQRQQFQQIARKHDPNRLYIDSDSVAVEVLDPKNDRDTLDFYTIPFNEYVNPLDHPDKFSMARPKKPVISHESGNYITFSRPELVERFQHNFKPFWLTAGKARLQELNLTAESERWADKSERLYVLCHKFNTEGMRLNPFITGYQWWLLQDYWTTANGIFDHYFEPKGISTDEILKFNSDVVLLQEGLHRTYRGLECLDLKLLVSNFAIDPLDGELTWEIANGKQVIASKKVAASAIGQGELGRLVDINFQLPDVETPVRLKISAKLDARGQSYANDWSTWVYPSKIAAKLNAIPVMADPSLIKAMTAASSVKPIPNDGELDAKAVYVVTALDSRIVDALGRGSCVVLINDTKPVLDSGVISFRTSWWKGTTNNQINHTGTFVYDHPVTQATAPDGWCDDGWLHLVEGSRRYNLDAAPARPDVIIRALPTYEKVVDQALLFEVMVGEGCLIVSGLNHQGAGDRPENQWILARLLERASQLPKPSVQWPKSFFVQ